MVKRKTSNLLSTINLYGFSNKASRLSQFIDNSFDYDDINDMESNLEQDRERTKWFN